MKRFIISSLLMLTASIGAWACGGEGYTHNYYMLNLYPGSYLGWNDPRITDFWKQYVGNTDDYYWTNLAEAGQVARQKGDEEMLIYVKLLDLYLQNCGEISNGWDYPTREELDRQNETMQKISTVARAYSGQRLQAQYALLAMRANMQLERHADNKAYWEQTASRLPDSAYREWMKNIYAGALLRTGEKMAAWNIYAQQNDWVSLRWSVFKYRNLAGIKAVFADNPTAPVLAYLVQDFVNSVQETQDQMRLAEEFDGMDREYIDDAVNMTGNYPVYQQEVDDFIAFATTVAAGRQTDTPCLWKTACGMLHYLNGQYDTAVRELDAAQKMAGTQRMKDNARCIRLLASAAVADINKKYTAYLLKEMQWLDGKIKAAAEDDGYYAHAKDRIMHLALAPAYRRAGRSDMAMALLQAGGNEWRSSEPAAEMTWNYGYSSEFFGTVLEETGAAELAAYFSFLKSSPKDAFERYVIAQIQPDDNYFNDMIGTKYIAEGKFAEAIPYLEKVPLAFLQQQNTSWYQAHRDYTLPRWMGKQKAADDEATDGANLATISTNRKIDFCREMMQLSSQYLLAGDAQARKRIAYQLAVRYYQASLRGDCWFLTHYGTGCYAEPRAWEADFVEKARIQLQECATAGDFRLMEESLYALAFIPADSWIEYDWERGTDVVRPDSRQYQALAALDAFARQHRGQLSEYVTKCDVLKQFRKYN